MVLRTLEMQGFKSFPDRTELNFGKGITAVVGPNGSGKSNISDAVRWVLGETSTKSLRGSKMEDVIFGGTSARKALGFAQVQLTLDNADGALKDRGEIVTVSRRYYRSGESEYKIDGETVRRKDIHELFMDTGLGSDGYSMVGQGKIDSIISQKNEDRRELFEEAAGISLFRHKRTDATRRLDQAQENLVRLLDILGELENRVGPLKKQSEKAAQFLELSQEKKTLEIGVWVNKIKRFTNDLREQEHKIDAAEASYQVCENELKKIENEIEEALEKSGLINIELEQLRAIAKSNEEEALREDGKAMVLESTVSHNNETIQRLRDEINMTDDANQSIDTQIEEKNQLIAEGESSLADKQLELKQTSEKMESLVSSNETNSKLTNEINQRITSLTVALSECRVKCTQALSSIDEIKARQSVVDESIAVCDKELNIAIAQQEESQKNLDFLEERINENSNSLSGYRLKYENKKAKAEKLKESLEKLNYDLSQKRSKAKMLLDLEKNMEGFSGAVRAVMKQSQSKSLSGIHGPLSQLITVDNEYSVAVEVALGAAMQNIVTTNEADAKRAIYYLKNNKLGRATFLPISAIKPRRLDEKNLDDCLGFVAIASNLVDCKSEYENIVSNLLGRVVIVDDMDSAIGISKQYGARFKIVTIDGQVINPGGAMTGGSQSKGAGILSRSNMIDELNSQASELEKESEALKAELKAAIEAANLAGANLQGVEADLQQAKEEQIRAQGNHTLICEKLDAAKAQKEQLIDEKTNAGERISQLEKANKAAQADADIIEKQMADAENELNKTAVNAEEINAKRDSYRQRIQEINLDIVTTAKDIEALKISVEELTLRKDTQKNRVKSTADEIASIEEKNDAYLIDINKIKATANDYRKKAQDSLHNADEKIEERNSLEKRSAELRTFERNKSQEREKLSGEIVRLTEHKVNMQKEYDELNDMLFEQYELTRREAEALNIEIENMTEAKKRLHEIKVAIKGLGSINVGSIEEYKEVSERYEFLKEQIDDIEKSKSELLKIIEDLTSSMSEKFLEKFNKINEEFKISFADFFGGGKGEIVLEQPDNCLESPIEIKIQPPGKSVQNINLFSGGEKSLAAMALLFSVLKVQPAPFCIYDEVEAALDDVNVERFAKYMRKMTDKTQFISITHRRGTMEEADVLYGVTMQEKGVSKLIELQTAELAAKMGLE
ncbi:MAG: chromosome segregation protein SMC [Acetobacter sp.]|nr:chromosome segregation protein SMC [Bacteroides sp.]MCM1340724.1 chromosome segregation protein SMC [Acetobacter sp.]MCM1433061.1 chromosome segregation protein SMC [Clostridiales bacterium]